MTNYILRRLAQAIPQLFIISIILFTLMQAFGDPIATLGGRIPPRPEDKERLRRQLGTGPAGLYAIPDLADRQ